jgi:hypothetical protein
MRLVDISKVRYMRLNNILRMYGPQADECFITEAYRIKLFLRSPNTSRLVEFVSWFQHFDPNNHSFVVFMPTQDLSLENASNIEDIINLRLCDMTGYSYRHFNA